MDVKVSLNVKAEPERTTCRLECDGREVIVIFKNDEHGTVEFESATAGESAVQVSA
jgi:hypothetical protein